MKKDYATATLLYDKKSAMSFANAVIVHLYERSGGDSQMFIEELGIVAKTLDSAYETQRILPLSDEEFPF